MDSAKQQLTDKLKTANNILVTVSRNPSVDQLASCIGLTLLLNKQGKHAAAVFSGEVPSTLEFLQPADTLEKNTDSLRDFIIALDKSKADKLRYKVEDNIVRIFITPYKTSISQDDLEFSEGDFNVDVVVALGVHQQEDLDEAITANGRILHDATVTSINTSPDRGLGTINWHDPQASSLSELVTELAQILGENLLDNQIATALLTGIVSETARFSNDKTSSQTMSASAALMAAGANQQLVASKLEEPVLPSLPGQSGDSGNDGQDPSSDQQPKTDDGMIKINHDDETSDEASGVPSDSALPPTDTAEPIPSPPSPDVGGLLTGISPLPRTTELTEPPTNVSTGARLLTEPPILGGTLTANSTPEALDETNDTLGFPSSSEPSPLLYRPPDAVAAPALALPAVPPTLPTPDPVYPTPATPTPTPNPGFTPPPQSWLPPASPTSPASSKPYDDDKRTLTVLESAVVSPHVVDQPLTKLEESVGSSHINAGSKSLDVARDEVSRALTDTASTTMSMTPEPIQALNAQQLGNDLHPAATDTSAVPTPQIIDSNAPPPVPPPIPFQFGSPSPPQ